MRTRFLCLLLLFLILLNLAACTSEPEETVIAEPSQDGSLTEPSASPVVDNNNISITKNIEQLKKIDRSDLTEEFLQGADGNPADISALYISESAVVFSTQWNVLVAKAKGSEWEFYILNCWELSGNCDHGFLMRGDGGLLAIKCFDDILLLDWKYGNIDNIGGDEMLHPLAWEGSNLYIGYGTPICSALYIYNSETDIIEKIPIEDEEYKDIVNHVYLGDKLYYSKEEQHKAMQDILMAK